MFIVAPLQIMKTWRQLRYPSWWVDKQTLGTTEMWVNEDKPWKDPGQSGKARDRMSVIVQQSIKCKSVGLYRSLLERSETADVQKETGMMRSSGQQNYHLWFYSNIHTYRYTTLGVSLHSADTGWWWRHASVASPTAADAHTLRHRKSALCMLFVFFLLWQNIWQQQLWKGRVYVGSRGEEIVHHGGENVATANTEWVFPPQLNSQDLTRITLSPLEKTTQIKWAVMRTLWSFFVLFFF